MKHLRQNYTRDSLSKHDMLEDPFDMFEKWFEDALSGGVMEPNAMTLSTSMNDKVDSRTVLLKDVRDREFVFFSNYQSNKGKHLEANPNCSLLFLWLAMERQVVVRGEAHRIPAEESDEYFHSRPFESRVGAWASNQSQEVATREDLDGQMESRMAEFKDGNVPRPDHWGGFAVVPYEIEFWQGRAGRLHDRMLYRLIGNDWELVRLQP